MAVLVKIRGTWSAMMIWPHTMPIRTKLGRSTWGSFRVAPWNPSFQRFPTVSICSFCPISSTLMLLICSIYPALLRHRGMGQQDFSMFTLKWRDEYTREQQCVSPLVLPQIWPIPYLVSLTMGYPIKIYWLLPAVVGVFSMFGPAYVM